MANSNKTGSPLEAAAGGAGSHVTDAFKLLSDEIRLAILLALWEAYDPHAEDNTVSFSELFDRVGMDDSGNFSYHLNKLVGNFVEETATGYCLRNSGLKIVRAVIAGSGLEERRLSPTEIPRSCYHCGAPVELSYEDERLYQICTECEGNIGPDSTERAPVGTLIVYDDFNPAGLAHRTPEEVFVAGTIEYERAVTLLIRGVCPECSGPVEESVHTCESHEAPPGKLCPACGAYNEVRVSYVCSVCKHSGSYPAWTAVYDHPVIVAFYYEHGFNMTYGLDDPEDCARLWDLLKKEQTLVSVDPVRIRVTVSCDGAELYLTLDGDLTVIDVARDDPQTDRGTTEGMSTSVSKDPIPDADLVTASLILHGENLEDKKMMIDKIYDAVNPGGTFVAIDNIIDDDRRENTFGLLMSLNMLVHYGDAFDYTGEQFESWAEEAGFENVQIRHLNGPTSMAIAHKR